MNNRFGALVREGRIPEGTELYHPWRGQRPPAWARVVAEGIHFGDQIYPSPSTAARAAAQYATNGWTFWRIKATGAVLNSLRG